MKNSWVKELKVGDEVVDFFALRNKELKEYNGNSFLRLELTDRTGRIEAVLWNQAREAYDSLPQGEVVKVKGRVGTYKDNPQITLERVREALSEEYDPRDFLPSKELDVDGLLTSLREKIAAVHNPHLKAVLNSVFSDQDFLRKFKLAPAGKLWHHTYAGGLLEHTLTVTEICEKVAPHYKLLDRDLLVTGAVLHDIGKTEELTGTLFFDYSDVGRLEGHIAIGCQMVQDRIRELKDFPENLAARLKHLILSHHGTKENGSPVVPQSLEAFVLYYVDELDSKTSGVTRIMESESAPDKRWSDWVNLLERFIYLGE
jgi:3'-5' exoribonuclease